MLPSGQGADPTQTTLAEKEGEVNPQIKVGGYITRK